MTIPVQNIYYLLCYAWDKLDEKEIVNVEQEDITELINLFAKVLINGTTHLLKRGLDRYYVKTCEVISGIKGKLNLDATLNKNLLKAQKTVCSYDDFNYNILHNQLLRTTIYKLRRTENIDEDIRRQLKLLDWRLSEIDVINITAPTFSKASVQ